MGDYGFEGAAEHSGQDDNFHCGQREDVVNRTEELWKQAVNNKTFKIAMDLQDLDIAFQLLAPDDWMLHDKYGLFHTQLKLVQSEVQRLKDRISGLNPRK